MLRPPFDLEAYSNGSHEDSEKGLHETSGRE